MGGWVFVSCRRSSIDTPMHGRLSRFNQSIYRTTYVQSIHPSIPSRTHRQPAPSPLTHLSSHLEGRHTARAAAAGMVVDGDGGGRSCCCLAGGGGGEEKGVVEADLQEQQEQQAKREEGPWQHSCGV